MMKIPLLKHLLLGLVVLTINNSREANSHVVFEHPYALLRLGGGYDPTRPLDSLRRCVADRGDAATYDADFAGAVAAAQDEPNRVSRAVRTTFELREVRSQRDLLSAIGRSASIEGNYSAMSAGYEEGSSSTLSIRESDIVFVLVARSDFGRDILRNPTISADLSQLSPNEFYQRCGTYFLHAVFRSVRIAVVFRFHQYDSTRTEETRASLRAGFQKSLYGASGEAANNSSFQETVSRMSMDINVLSSGGPAINEYKNLIENTTTPDKVRQAISQLVQSTSIFNAAPQYYLASSYEILDGGISAATLALAEDLSLDLGDLSAILRNWNRDARLALYSGMFSPGSAEFNSLNAKIEEGRQLQTELRAQGAACFSAWRQENARLMARFRQGAPSRLDRGSVDALLAIRAVENFARGSRQVGQNPPVPPAAACDMSEIRGKILTLASNLPLEVPVSVWVDIDPSWPIRMLNVRIALPNLIRAELFDGAWTLEVPPSLSAAPNDFWLVHNYCSLSPAARSILQLRLTFSNQFQTVRRLPVYRFSEAC
jgi:hypothetical protein